MGGIKGGRTYVCTKGLNCAFDVDTGDSESDHFVVVTPQCRSAGKPERSVPGVASNVSIRAVLSQRAVADFGTLESTVYRRKKERYRQPGGRVPSKQMRFFFVGSGSLSKTFV